MKSRCGLVLALCLAFCLAAGALHAAETGRLFQTSTLQALMAGVYDGDLTFQELARHGDFGLGTFEALDGGMIALDGAFYQIKADGRGQYGRVPLPFYRRGPPGRRAPPGLPGGGGHSGRGRADQFFPAPAGQPGVSTVGFNRRPAPGVGENRAVTKVAA